MTLNLAWNATGLDGVARYNVDGVGSTDETVMGGPGRIVIKASGAFIYLVMPVAGLAAAAGSVHHPVGTAAHLEWIGGPSASLQVPLVRRATGQGPARRGVPGTFHHSAVGNVAIPAGATDVLMAVTGPAGTPAMLKPWLGETLPLCGWRPGRHDNPDLDLPVWPSLPMPQVGGYSVSPTGMRSGFDTDSRVPITMEVNASPWHMLRATVSLDMLQRDQLQQFYESAAQPFWYVRPDTAQVCRAWWLDDGDPEDNGLGRGRTTSYGLLLEPA